MSNPHGRQIYVQPPDMRADRDQTVDDETERNLQPRQLGWLPAIAEKLATPSQKTSVNEKLQVGLKPEQETYGQPGKRKAYSKRSQSLSQTNSEKEQSHLGCNSGERVAAGPKRGEKGCLVEMAKNMTEEKSQILHRNVTEKNVGLVKVAKKVTLTCRSPQKMSLKLSGSSSQPVSSPCVQETSDVEINCFSQPNPQTSSSQVEKGKPTDRPGLDCVSCSQADMFPSQSETDMFSFSQSVPACSQSALSLNPSQKDMFSISQSAPACSQSALLLDPSQTTSGFSSQSSSPQVDLTSVSSQNSSSFEVLGSLSITVTSTEKSQVMQDEKLEKVKDETSKMKLSNIKNAEKEYEIQLDTKKQALVNREQEVEQEVNQEIVDDPADENSNHSFMSGEQREQNVLPINELTPEVKAESENPNS